MSSDLPPLSDSARRLLEKHGDSIHLLRQTRQLHYLFTIIRDVETKRMDFVFYSERIMRLVIEEALCLIPMRGCTVTTPTQCSYAGVRPDDVGLVGVSILRAGEAMERVLREMCRGVRIGKVLIQRDEASADKRPDARFHYSKMPPDIAERRVLLMDPMCGTGGSVLRAMEVLLGTYGVKEEHVIFLNVVASPQGLDRLLRQHPRIQIVTAAIDEGLDANQYIIPGLGDFGDRYFGTLV